MAEEKQILEVDVQFDALAKYKDLLDATLGSYQDNIKLLGDYNAQIKANNAAIAELNKTEKTSGELTAEQKSQIVALTAENRKLQVVKAQLQQTIKSDEKIMTSQNTSLERQSQVLGKLRTAWQLMSADQRSGNQQLLQDIQKLDSVVKQQDYNIGKFQRNVGNYPQILQQILPVQGPVASGFTNIAQSIGVSAGALTVLTGVLGVGVAAFKVFQSAMNDTQVVGDFVAHEASGWGTAWDKFIYSLVSADFSNLIDQLKEAYQAGKDYAAMIDELTELKLSLSIAEAESSLEQQQNLAAMRDQTKSDEERIAAGEAFIAKEQELGERRKKIAQDEFNAESARWQALTGLQGEAIIDLLRTYDQYQSQILEYNANLEYQTEYYRSLGYGRRASAKMAKGDVQKGLSPEFIEMLEVFDQYNLRNDEETKRLVDAYNKIQTAEADAMKGYQRALTTLNSLRNQLLKDAEAKAKALEEANKKAAEEAARDHENAAKDIQSGINAINKEFDSETKAGLEESRKSLRQQVTQFKRDFVDLQTELAEEIEAGNETGELKQYAMSPIARLLGISDEEFTQIKQKVISAAQSIAQQVTQIQLNAIQSREEDLLDSLDRETDSRKTALEAQRNDGLISQERYEKELAQIDEEAAARQEEIRKQSFEEQKKWNILQAIMNAALSITNIWATSKGTLAMKIAETVIATASCAAQIATISAQKYAQGGLITGPSHAQGGVKASVGGRQIELEGGESVINKRSTAKYYDLLSAINSDNGWGVPLPGARGSFTRSKFATGGIIPTPAPLPQQSGAIVQQLARNNDYLEKQIRATNERIDRMRVEVLLDDIETQSNRKRVYVSRSRI